MKNTIILITLFISLSISSQNKLPYYEIPDNTTENTAGSIASRMIDGLGFRFYWATEGLEIKDLSYQPTQEARSTEATIDHILDLSQVIVNAAENKPNGEKLHEMTFNQKRARILKNFKKASDLLKNETDLSDFKIIFGTKEFSFLNAINGPIADAIWHTGQIASFRRSSGNPIPKGPRFLTGKVKK